MIIGDPSIFAIESNITDAYERLDFLALGYFVLHIGGNRYGVQKSDAAKLGHSFEEVINLIGRRGEHTAPFSSDLDAGKIADVIHNPFYGEPKPESYFGIPVAQLWELTSANNLRWKLNWGNPVDDGSNIVHFDVQGRVRLIAFKSDKGYGHDATTLKDVWLPAEDFYSILISWRKAFKAEWDAMVKVEAPEEPSRFDYSASLRIFGVITDLDALTRDLGIRPTHTHRKGERRSRRGEPYESDGWQYTAPVQSMEPLHAHIDALWAAVRDRKDYLLQLKKDLEVDIFLGYRSTSDCAGVDIPYQSLEIFRELQVPFGLSIIVA